MANFETIGIIAKRDENPEIGVTLERLVCCLSSFGREVYFDEVSGAKYQTPSDHILTLAQMGQRCSLAIVVGGDGTLLHGARSMAKSGVPLVGINLGRLGFLVDVSPEEIEVCLERILAGEYEEESRHMLVAHVDGHPACEDDCLALNDVVVHKWNTARLIELETYIDGKFVNAQRSDGIIVSTPTGSTAYALSGGGPLLHPALDALALVPISPHTLSNRPLVIAGGSHIEIRIRERDRDHVHVTCDGRTTAIVQSPVRVFVEKAPRPARLLHPKGHDYYKILRAKLGWGGNPPNQPTPDAR
jgi:NAD+ kinase